MVLQQGLLNGRMGCARGACWANSRPVGRPIHEEVLLDLIQRSLAAVDTFGDDFGCPMEKGVVSIQS